MRGDAFTAEQKARNFAYYEPLTVRDSSLSACTQAVIAAEVGHLELAYDYLGEAALMDLRRPASTTPATACTWPRWPAPGLALVAGFGGLRAGAGDLAFAPRLPGGITRLTFRMRYRGRKLSVTVEVHRARYQLLEGDPLVVSHYGQSFELGSRTVERKIPALHAAPRPEQPPGRAPYNRSGGD